eukprot:PhF_6_TR5143/c0_g1_i1/m.7346
MSSSVRTRTPPLTSVRSSSIRTPSPSAIATSLRSQGIPSHRDNRQMWRPSSINAPKTFSNASYVPNNAVPIKMRHESPTASTRVTHSRPWSPSGRFTSRMSPNPAIVSLAQPDVVQRTATSNSAGGASSTTSSSKVKTMGVYSRAVAVRSTTPTQRAVHNEFGIEISKRSPSPYQPAATLDEASVAHLSASRYRIHCPPQMAIHVGGLLPDDLWARVVEFCPLAALKKLATGSKRLLSCTQRRREELEEVAKLELNAKKDLMTHSAQLLEISSTSIDNIRSSRVRPHAAVLHVLQLICVMMSKDGALVTPVEAWTICKFLMQDVRFLHNLVDAASESELTLTKRKTMRQILMMGSYSRESILTHSGALCMIYDWIMKVLAL